MGPLMCVTITPAADVAIPTSSASEARLCVDKHGNNVAQRILQKYLPQCSKFIFDTVTDSAGDVARHRHDCCVTPGDDLINTKII